MHIKRRLLVVAICHLAAAQLVVAQTTAVTPMRSLPDSARMSAMMGPAMRRMRPAQFALDHRDELALTAEQIPFLESLALAQIDSERVRAQRRTAAFGATAKTGSASTADPMSWTGPIDEEAIRALARQQVDQSTELMIQMALDRHAVGAVLTPVQITILRRAETNDLMRAAGFPAAVRPASPK